MRVRVLSDIHSEFHADGGYSFVNSLHLGEQDLVVLAGDIGSRNTIAAQIGALCSKFFPTPVLYIPGNHEHYRATWSELWAILRTVSAPNLLPITPRQRHFVCGRVVVACTLWFPETPFSNVFASNISDFSEIPNYREWVYEENRRDVQFLRTHMDQSSVVVTHYLPTPHSITPQFTGSPLNQYFLTDLTEEIVTRGPKLWIHGHTHSSVKYKLGETEVVCNPFGYAMRDLNENFRENCVVMVADKY